MEVLSRPRSSGVKKKTIDLEKYLVGGLLTQAAVLLRRDRLSSPPPFPDKDSINAEAANTDHEQEGDRDESAIWRLERHRLDGLEDLTQREPRRASFR